MITKLTSVRNMGVFDGFDWDACVRNANGQVERFEDVNLIYGRNYSGKTTLSRILAAFETRELPARFEAPEFSVETRTDGTLTHASLDAPPFPVRVFNTDFVRRNLRFIVDDEHDIEPFAVLGEDNARVEVEIEQKTEELGSEQEETGLMGDVARTRTTHTSARQATTEAETTVTTRLRNKATGRPNGIKDNALYGDPRYDIRKLKSDLEAVAAETYEPLEDEEAARLEQLLREQEKPAVPELPELALSLDALSETARELCERRIISGERIAHLVEDARLETWVRAGIPHHKEKRDTCAFCGGELNDELWAKLAGHFSKESEVLRSDIEVLLDSITEERERVSSLLTVDMDAFYSVHREEAEALSLAWDEACKEYARRLDEAEDQAQSRLADIFTVQEWTAVPSARDGLETARERHNQLARRTEEMTSALETEKAGAKDVLRLHAVHVFAADVGYVSALAEIGRLKQEEAEALTQLEQANARVTAQQEEIARLRTELRDERRGAQRVNDYLNHYFGHQGLSLDTVESEDGVRFRVSRGGTRAYQLSEGESSLIGFCYFIARLEDIETTGSTPIIWIDDPISSLDANHVFFVFSLINSAIVQANRFRQLFISTHNLPFMNYLKRLHDRRPNGQNYQRQYLLVERDGDTSAVRPMPGHIKEYVTEFNHMFHQIYRCAVADNAGGEHYGLICQFANCVRRFLETFLYFKYPDARSDRDGHRLAQFLGDEPVARTLIQRISNEYSHMARPFERGAHPLDVPEMQQMARFLLSKIRDNDSAQYEALLASVGEDDPLEMAEDAE